MSSDTNINLMLVSIKARFQTSYMHVRHNIMEQTQHTISNPSYMDIFNAKHDLNQILNMTKQSNRNVQSGPKFKQIISKGGLFILTTSDYFIPKLLVYRYRMSTSTTVFEIGDMVGQGMHINLYAHTYTHAMFHHVFGTWRCENVETHLGDMWRQPPNFREHHM